MALNSALLLSETNLICSLLLLMQRQFVLLLWIDPEGPGKPGTEAEFMVEPTLGKSWVESTICKLSNGCPTNKH